MLIFNKQKNKYFQKISALFILSFFIFVFSFNLISAQNPDPEGLGGADIVDPSPDPDVLGDPASGSNDPQSISPTSGSTNPGQYKLLAPLPGLENYDASSTVGEGCALSKYFNVLIKLFIGISAVLAMIMIVIGGITYMTSESISHKGAGLEQAQNAVFGLLLALAAYAILNTINPKLLNLCPQIPEATIVIGPEAGDDTVDPGYANGIKVYSTDASVTPSVAAAAAKLATGWEITKINVYTSNTMQIDMKKGAEFDNSTYLPIAPGLNGYAPVGTAHSGDKKTPLGTWQILAVNYSPGVAQFSQTGSNMGAAFWLLSPMNSGERGIGIHGNKNGTLSNTNGCVRMKNSDILALQPYIHSGIQVVVQ